MSGDFLDQLALHAADLVRFDDGTKPVEVKPAVGDVLVVDETPDTFEADGLGDGGKRPRDLMLDECRRRRSLLLFFRRFLGLEFGARGVVAGAESVQVAVDGFAVVADRRLELFRAQRQAAGADDGAEHHRTDHRAALFCERIHVDEQGILRCSLTTLTSLSWSKRPSPIAIFSSMA